LTQPDSQLLARADTAIGHLVLRRREIQASPGTFFLELLVDDRVLMSDYNSLSERALAREGVARCRGDRLRVLVGGLGLGHTAHEVLASPRVAALDVVEFVPEVIAWFEGELITLAPQLRADPRLRVVEDDVYARLHRAVEPSPIEGGPIEDGPSEDGPSDAGSRAARYDLILIDVDHAPDEPLTADSAAFYTPEGLRRVCDHLAPAGILAVWSCSENQAFEATLREVFARVDTETTLFQDDMFWEDDEVNYLFFASQPRA